MNKICTSLEQSQKLIELGIDVNSADMHYVRKKTDFMGNLVDGKWSEPRYGNPNSRYANYVVQNFSSYETIPCWSLAALLEYMNRNFYNISLNYCGAEYTISFDDGEKYKTITRDYSIDAAFEMICWLKENNKLKSL